jgi:hypothetical protein
MTILVHAFRSWAAAEPERRPTRTLPACTGALAPLRATRRPHLEMRWHLDRAGRLTCTWQLVSHSTSVRSDDEEAEPLPWLWVFARTENHQASAKRQ